MRHQGATVGQPGQIVVISQEAQLLLGVDAGLDLREERGDRLEGVEFLGRPILIPNVTNPSAPVVTSPESNGTEASDGIVIPLPSATRRW